jgi:ketopantoate reductase
MQAEWIGGLFRDAGLLADVFDDLLPAQWSKLIFNATVNSIAAAACGVELYQDPWQMVQHAASQYRTATGHGRVPSMLADVRAGRATEVDWINGPIVCKALEHDLKAPLNACLYRIIKVKERNEF